MNRFLVLGVSALLTVMTAGCAVNTTETGSENDEPETALDESDFRGTPRDRAARGGNSESLMEVRLMADGENEGPHPVPWTPAEGPHPVPWIESTSGSGSGSSNPNDPTR